MKYRKTGQQEHGGKDNKDENLCDVYQVLEDNGLTSYVQVKADLPEDAIKTEILTKLEQLNPVTEA